MTNEEKAMEEYIKSQSMATGTITNKSLLCRDCKFRGIGLPTAFCEVYKKGTQRKPNSVLLGGNCVAYEHE